MTCNFYLAGTPTKRGEYTIRMYITAVPRGNRKPITITVGRRIKKKDWDAVKQRVKTSYIGSPELNRFLNTLRVAVQRKYDEMCANLGAANVRESNFKPEVLRLFTPDEQETSKDFMTVFDEFIESQRLTSAKNTVQKYVTVRNYLQSFQETKRFDLTFDTIDFSFQDAFRQYLIKDVGLLNNSINKVFSMIKTFLHWATQRKYNNSDDFRTFKIKYEDVDTVYLTEPELMSLYRYDFSTAPSLEKVRDVFCFQCFTGQRFSDVAACNFNDIKQEQGKWFWLLRTRKTKSILKIPLTTSALAIVEKYRESGKLPIISAQKTNQYLKQACQTAGIDELVQRVTYRGNERIEEREAKYAMISTHTARRTFVTLSLERGMRPESVMKITGHSDFKMMKKYIRLTENVVAQEMANTWNEIQP